MKPQTCWGSVDFDRLISCDPPLAAERCEALLCARQACVHTSVPGTSSALTPGHRQHTCHEVAEEAICIELVVHLHGQQAQGAAVDACLGRSQRLHTQTAKGAEPYNQLVC